MWEHFKDWLGRPFDTEMDALGWFLFLGLLIVLSAMWAVILKHLKEAMS